jgi:hypothetical protein
MSEPKRYRLDPESYLAEHPQGDFVDYQDYARLKAENARLRASSFVTAVPVEEYERVVKAGDAMAEGLLKYIQPTDGYLTYLECRANWNAAKEGKSV